MKTTQPTRRENEATIPRIEGGRLIGTVHGYGVTMSDLNVIHAMPPIEVPQGLSLRQYLDITENGKPDP